MASYDPTVHKSTCGECGKKFEWIHQLQRHIRTAHHQNIGFHCIPCGTSFTKKHNLVRHQRTKHSDTTTPVCDKCKKSFSRIDNLKTHQKSCSILLFVCPRCKRTFKNLEDLDMHLALCPFLACKTCDEKFDSKSELDNHAETHKNSRAKRIKRGQYYCGICLQNSANREELFQHKIHTHLENAEVWQPIQPHFDFDNEAINEVLRKNKTHIFQRNKIDDVISSFNFPVTQLIGNEHWMSHIKVYIDALSKLCSEEAFKLNFGLGFVLMNKETEKFRYFIPHRNNDFFDQPILIDRPSSWEQVHTQLTPEKLLAYVTNHRPDTKWIPIIVTNLNVRIYYLGITMGVGMLPDYIKLSHSILGLDYNIQSGGHNKPYNDQHCALRCLVCHYNLKSSLPWHHNLEDQTQQLLGVWGRNGVSLDDVNIFEDTFKINVDILSLCEDGAVIPRYLSEGEHSDKMTLNLYNNHLSYVKNVPAYLKKYKCDGCDRHFSQLIEWKRHRGSCVKSTVFEFPGNSFKLKNTLFEDLEEIGIDVPSKHRVFPWFAVYDFEALLEPCLESHVTDKLSWKSQHAAISVSICSNVPGYEKPHCFVDQDSESLINKMMTYLGHISDSAHAVMEEKWEPYLDSLSIKLDEANEIYKKSEDTIHKPMIKKLNQLKLNIHNYCRQLPVLGFNSSKYDLNLVKQNLIPWLTQDIDDESLSNAERDIVEENDLGEDEEPNVKKHNLRVIKNGSLYIILGNYRFNFLDISNYLAAGVSYSKFLKAFKMEEKKSYFPYEWFDNADKLDYPSLPPYEAFFSTLKNRNVLDEDGDGLEQYYKLQDIWTKSKMQTFRDFLIYYNNLDVAPFVSAVTKMQRFYFERDIDLFKVAVSVPGIARRWLFEVAFKARASFALIHRDDDDLYYTLKKNIVGGPSIIFTREAEVGKTCIRDDPNMPCQNIVGFDANALYLWAIGEPMPCGGYVRRFEPDFKPVSRLKHEDMFHWMDYIQETKDLHIKHARNNKSEIRIGPYLVDGFDSSTNTVYEYNGCFYHGCTLCGYDKTPVGKERKEHTEKKERFLRKNKYNLEVMWEHEFKHQQNMDKQLCNFIEKRQPPFYRHYPYGVTMDKIIKCVKKDKFFGFLEVDLHVPDHLYTYFEEMSPLFCNSDIPFNSIGPFMQEYARKKEMSEKPRRLLVGGMRARRILLSSCYLKWMMEKGLVVTHLYQVIEYSPIRCFARFVEQVSEARRVGDIDPDQGIIADTMKLIGNSGYGSLIMDKEKHQNVSYIEGKGNAHMKINQPRFRKCTMIKENLFEFEMAKSKIKMDLPIQLGYHILQLAKLKMLQFRYDFLEQYCNKKTFEYIEMDTDSAYMAISGKCLTDIVRPSMQQAFRSDLYHRCNDLPFTAADGFLPRECCLKHSIYDKRTPGLFKLECEGVAMIALCSKTYVLKQADGKVKFTSKGINKSTLANAYSTFQQVLNTQKPHTSTNMGFRVRDNQVCTYQQEICGLSYFYCKREVLPDGIHTRPLAITLTPWSDHNVEVVGEDHPWSLTEVHDFTIENKICTLCLADKLKSFEEKKSDYQSILNHIKEYIRQLPPHRPKSDNILFPITEAMKKLDYKFWKSDTYWTTGMSFRATPLKTNHPGQNMLGKIIKDAM